MSSLQPGPIGSGGAAAAAASTMAYLELKSGATVARGSTATTRNRFSVSVRSEGLAATVFTVTDSAANSTVVQINEAGDYWVDGHCQLSTAGSLGVRITAASPDNGFVTTSGEYPFGYGNGNNSVAISNGRYYIPAGSYISVSSSGTVAQFPELCRLIISRA